MPQSLVKNYMHITFSTKYRMPLIDNEIENELFSYLGGICNAFESIPVQVGGHKNHVHILCMLSRKIALMKLLQEVKSHSSKWIKTKGKRYENFFWQNGYGAFSVNQKGVENVRNYIINQRQHHERKSFKEEYLEFLKLYDIEYDERYIWD